MTINLKRSSVDPEDPTPEGSLTLVSNLLWVVVNRELDILGNLTKLNITKLSCLVNFSIERTLKKNTQKLLQI